MKIGWHLAQGDSRDDFVLDPVGHADFASGLTDRLKYLTDQVATDRYRPRHLLEVDVPKSDLSVRPGNVLPIEEAALLHAIVYVLAPHLDKHLDDGVYSYRLDKKGDWKKKAKKGEAMFREMDVEVPFLRKATLRSINVFESWYERWPEFEDDAHKAVSKEGYTHLTKTDISAYFENIDLRLLHDQIRVLLKREEERVLQLLFRILDAWTRSTSAGMPIGRGIPQGNNVSSFLGNIYLIPLDRALIRFAKKHDAKWFRYVDDVKVFTRNERDARAAVFVINESLRSLHLNLQGAKTEILTGAALTEEHENSALDAVDSAFRVIAKIDCADPTNRKRVSIALKPISPLCQRFTRGLPVAVRGIKGKDNRLFRRLLTVYGLAGRSRKQLPEAALTAIRELPDLRVLRSALTYLTRLGYSTHDAWVDRLLTMLEEDDLLFPYQSGAVLEALTRFHPTDPSAVASRIRRYAFGPTLNRKRAWLVHMKGIEALLSYPYRERYIPAIVQKYVAHEHPMVRRAAVAIAPRCPKEQAREHLRKLLRHPDGAISRLAMYLHRVSSDTEYLKEEMGRVRKGNRADHAMVRRLPLLYAASTTEDRSGAEQMFETLDKLPKTLSVKLNWHWNQMRNRVKWCKP